MSCDDLSPPKAQSLYVEFELFSGPLKMPKQSEAGPISMTQASGWSFVNILDWELVVSEP